MEALFAAIAVSINSAVVAFLWIVAAALVYYILNWGLSKLPLSEPFSVLLRVILVILVCLFCINAVMTLVGHPLVTFR